MVAAVAFVSGIKAVAPVQQKLIHLQESFFFIIEMPSYQV